MSTPGFCGSGLIGMVGGGTGTQTVSLAHAQPHLLCLVAARGLFEPTLGMFTFQFETTRCNMGPLTVMFSPFSGAYWVDPDLWYQQSQKCNGLLQWKLYNSCYKKKL